MAGSSVVGALRVVLGADTAAFSKGLQQSEQNLSGFSKAAKVAGAAIGTALVGAAVSLGAAIKRTIDDADNLAKTSQKIGVPVEELSRLRHAAELSGIEFGSMTTALGRLSRNMSDVAAGSGAEAKRAFDQLGISVTNSDGSLKSSTQTMQEVATKFAGMEDGAAKTAISMQLFGRAGADLIPLLNQGAEGIQKMKDEADALGIVISTEAAKSAEEFNDNLDRLSKLGTGVTVAIVNEVTPALAEMSQVAFETAKAVKGMTVEVSTLTFELAALVGQSENVAAFFEMLTNSAINAIPVHGQLIAAYRALHFAVGQGSEAQVQFTTATQGLLGVSQQASGTLSLQKQATDAATFATDGATQAAQRFQAILREGQSVFMATRTAQEDLELQLQRLQELYDAGAISADTFARAAEDAAVRAQAAQQRLTNEWFRTMDMWVGALQGLFGKNKAFAVAQAVINVAEGITRALTLPFPLNWVQSAAVAAAGAAQVMAIKSQKVQGFAMGGSFTVPGGVSGVDNIRMPLDLASGERVDITPANENRRDGPKVVELSLRGQNFTRDHFREFADGYNRYAADGGTQIRVKAVR